jgi:hypothetical protein
VLQICQPVGLISRYRRRRGLLLVRRDDPALLYQLALSMMDETGTDDETRGDEQESEVESPGKSGRCIHGSRVVCLESPLRTFAVLVLKKRIEMMNVGLENEFHFWGFESMVTQLCRLTRYGQSIDLYY